MRRGLWIPLLCLLLTAVLTGFASAGMGNDGHGKGPPGDANPEISTELFTVRLVGRSGTQVPKFQYWYSTTEGKGTVYQVFFHKIFEFNDTDGDGAFNVTLGDTIETMFALPSGDQSLSGPELIVNTTSGEVIGVRLNFTILGKGGPSNGVNLTLQCSLYNKTQTLTGAGGTIYNVTGGAELKIDVIINRWPWKDSDNGLCLEWSVNHQNETVTPSIADSTVTLGGGYFKWLSDATVVNATGFEETVPVNSSFNMTGNTARVYLCYPNFGDKVLIHDPSLGVIIDTEPPIVSPQQTPTTHVLPRSPVPITVDAADTASGVESVVLEYSVDDGATWSSTEMAPSEGQYAASIPGQDEGTTVKYRVKATDAAGNPSVSEVYTYTTIPPGLGPWAIYGLAITAVLIAAVAFYIARTRTTSAIALASP